MALSDQTSDDIEDGFRHDVYLAFANADEEFALGVVGAALTDAGVDVHHAGRFDPGQRALAALADALTSSRYVVAILSPAFVADEITQFAVGVAQHLSTEEAERRVIPVVHRPVELDRHPLFLRVLVQLDLTDPANWSSGLRRLCEAVGKELLEPERPPCPYPGMTPFTEDQHHLFFGRGQEIGNIADRIRRESRLLLIGPSGSGKSSLVFAGVLPRLSSPDSATGLRWTTRQLRPGEDPVARLRLELDDDLADPERAVSQLVASAKVDRLLLVIDQLEELFSAVDDDARRSAFARTLVALSEHDSCCVVATMRADFYAELMESELWGAFQSHRVEVLPLRRTALSEAIRLPALTHDVYVEATLVQKLLDDAGEEPGMLPFMQETLRGLWMHLEWRFLPLSAYVVPREAYGEPPRTGLQRALENHAQSAIANLPETGRLIAKRVFLRLVQLGGGRHDVRQQRTMAELHDVYEVDQAVDDTVDALVEARLLTRDAEAGPDDTVAVDLAHEALISGWRQLGDWIDELRDAERVRSRLEVKAADWDRLQRRGGLLDEIELKEATGWVESDEAEQLGVDTPIRQLITASRDAIEARHRAEEEERDRRLRVTRRWLVAVTVVAATAISAAMVAWYQQNRADDEATERQAVELAVVSSQLADRSLDRALLLAVESYQRRPVPEAVESLVTTVARLPQLERVLHHHDAEVRAVAVSPDGSLFASAGRDHRILVSDDEGTQIAEITSHTGEVHGLAFDSRGSVLVSSSDDGTVRRWDTETFRQIGDASVGHVGRIRGIAVDVADRWVASAGHDSTVRVWDLATGAEVDVLEGHDDLALDVAFNADGTLLATAGADGDVIVYRTDDFAEISRLRFETPARSVDFHPASPASLAVGLNDTRVIIWDSERSLVVAEFADHDERVFDVAFSPDGAQLASAGRAQTVLVHDTQSGELLVELAGHAADVRSVAYSPDGRLVSGSRDRSVMLWDPDRAARLSITPFGDAPAVAVALRPDGRAVAVVGEPSSGYSLVAQSGDGTRRVALAGSPTTLALSPNGAEVAVGTLEGTVSRLDADTLDVIGEVMPSRRGALTTLAYAADGERLALGSEDGQLSVWDVSRAELTAATSLPEFAVVDLVFDQRGDVMYVSDTNGSIWSWLLDARDDNLRVFADNRIRARSLAVSVDGSRLVVGTDQDQVQLWIPDREPPVLATVIDHDGEIRSIEIDSRGRITAASEEAGTVTLWEIESGRRLGTLPAPGARVVAIADESPNVAVATPTGVQLWTLDVDLLIGIACDVANRNLTPDEWSTYIGGDHGETCPPSSDGG